MFFTDNKTNTLREAQAHAVVKMAPETLKRVQEKNTPKGDVLEVARTSGILAAKKTPELIPMCHPLPIEGIAIHFEFADSGILITSMVRTIWRTGVEMEALTAATIAALTIYDMLKPIDKDLEIIGIKLIEKAGGKSDFVEKIPPNFSAAVIVTSDGTHQGKRQDKSGKIICEKLRALGLQNIEYAILPDEKPLIQNAIKKFVQQGTRLIITTGGTGLGPRDVTVDATAEIITKEVPGIAEAMRKFGQERTPYAMLSRGLAGLIGDTIVINLPGSSNGAEQSMQAIFPAVLHAYKMMAGGGH